MNIKKNKYSERIKKKLSKYIFYVKQTVNKKLFIFISVALTDRRRILLLQFENRSSHLKSAAFFRSNLKFYGETVGSPTFIMFIAIHRNYIGQINYDELLILI